MGMSGSRLHAVRLFLVPKPRVHPYLPWGSPISAKSSLEQNSPQTCPRVSRACRVVCTDMAEARYARTYRHHYISSQAPTLQNVFQLFKNLPPYHHEQVD